MAGETWLLPSGHPVLHLAATGSTNADAMRHALSGASAPLWIVADRQTTGRGRAGRDWHSLPGNLHASVLLQLDALATAIPGVSLLAGISAIDAVRSVSPGVTERGLRLKWPNDILLAGAKVGGILVESTRRAAGFAVVVGFGINLVSAPQLADRSAAALTSEGDDGRAVIAREALVAALDGSLQRWLQVWALGEGFAEVRRAWLERGVAPGTPLTVNGGKNGVLAGTFAGLDSDGAMLLDVAGRGVERVTFGDVALAADDAGSRDGD